MPRSPRSLPVVLAAMLTVLGWVGMSGCGSSDAKSATGSAVSTARPAETTPPPATDGPATVKVGQSRLGSILVDASGRTLYLFKEDKPGRSLCTSDYLNCTTGWPPLMTTGRPHAQAGVRIRLLGSIDRTKPAGSQVTYNRHPLYLYIADKQPGDVEGQGNNSYWYVLSPSGRPITKK